jgi:hypothetical protein
MNESRFVISSVCILFLVFLITGCGDLKIASNFNPPEAKLGKFKAIEIADFETDIENLPKDALTKIPDEVAGLLISKNNFQKVARNAVEDVPAENTLVLVGAVTDYGSGTSLKAKEGAIRFGEAVLTIHIRLVEKATGDEVANGQVIGSSSIGFLKGGGITKGVYKAEAEEIVKYISQNH